MARVRAQRSTLRGGTTPIGPDKRARAHHDGAVVPPPILSIMTSVSGGTLRGEVSITRQTVCNVVQARRIGVQAWCSSLTSVLVTRRERARNWVRTVETGHSAHVASRLGTRDD